MMMTVQRAKQTVRVFQVLLLALLVGDAAVVHARVDKPLDPGAEPAITYRYPVTTAPLLAAAPTIDGTIDKAEWTTAAQGLPLMELAEGIVTEEAAQYWIGYTSDALYLAFRFERPSYADAPKAHDDPRQVWEDDCLELFLRPVFGERWEFNYVLNAKGVGGDGLRTGVTKKLIKGGWEGRTRLIANGWEGELRIPFAHMDREPPAPGDSWEFLVVRSRKTPTEETAVSSYLPDWDAVGDFGYLRFGGAAVPTVRVLQAGSLSATTGGGLLELINPAENRPVRMKIEADLYRPKIAAANYYKILHTEAHPLGLQAEGGEVLPSKGVVAQTLAQFEPVQHWAEEIELPAGQARRLAMSAAPPHGDYVWHYRVTDLTDNTLLAGGALPFKLTPPFVVSVENYLLVAQVLGITADYRRVPKLPDGSTVTARLLAADDGQILETATAPVDLHNRRTDLRLPTAGKLGGTFDLQVELLAPTGERLAEFQRPLTLPNKPVWFGNDIGKPHALGVVPEPWTPLTLTAADAGGFHVGVWGRAIDLNRELQPVQVIHREVPMTGVPKQSEAMLARPVHLRAKAQQTDLTYGPVELLSQTPGLIRQRVAITGPGLAGWLLLETEFDGLLKYTLDLEPADPNSAGQLDELSLEIALPAAIGTHYHYGHTGTRAGENHSSTRGYGALPAEGVSLPFAEQLWLGNDTLGWVWTAEWDRFWTPLDNTSAVRLEKDGDAAVMRINLVAQPRPATGPIRYQWGLLPVPAKPMNEELNHRLNLVQIPSPFDLATDELPANTAERAQDLAAAGVNAVNIWAYGLGQDPSQVSALWNPDFAGPSLNPATPKSDVRRRLLPEFVKIYHDAGIKRVLLFAMWNCQYFYPDMADFWREAVLQPLTPSYGGYDLEPGPVFNDWYMYHLEQTVKETGVNGVYLDSTAHARFSCNLFTGSGWMDENSDLRGRYPIFANRDLHQRLYTLLHTSPVRHGLVYAHNTHLHSPVVESFTNIHHCGEGSSLGNRDRWIAKFYGYQFGMPTTFTRWNKPVYPETRMASWRVANLLDIDIKGHPNFVGSKSALPMTYDLKNLPIRRIWDAWREYPWDGSIWVAPWRIGTLVTTGHPDVLASLHYNHGRAALLNVSSFLDQPVHVNVKVDWAALGLDPAAVTVTDVVTGETVVVEEGLLPLDILEQRWRMVEIKK